MYQNGFVALIFLNSLFYCSKININSNWQLPQYLFIIEYYFMQIIYLLLP